ncbi:DNA topoisomerase IV subunit B [Castellaniella sp.]|uniref:DNA topoisomerase IV subunit B n=1 Tax=Castellaniella sp. TaxID=1955812 RepID=UPI00355E39ED
MTDATLTTARYDESSIQVLKGLEPVRQRPGMYTRTNNPLHMLQEVIDNAADEALAGHARQIDVTCHADGSVSVQDDGRGIPVGPHPQERVPVIELVFTRLHAGGKFSKDGAAAYAFSGGLHGVGVSVTNALATRLEVTVWRDGAEWHMVFADGAVVQALKKGASVPRKRTGTRVRVWPDARFFDQGKVPLGELEHVLRSKAVLLDGCRVSLACEKTGQQREWHYAGGLPAYLAEELAGSTLLVPLFEGAHFVGADDEHHALGEGAHWAVAWSEEGPVVRESYVNLIATPAGGTHESGLREGLFSAVRSFAEMHGLVPKGLRLLPEDVFARASFVLSAKVLDPQFQGQIKERLNSRDAVRLVGGILRNALELWLHAHVEHGRKIAELAIGQARTRVRATRKVEKRKGSGVAVLPGKLTDCESSDASRTEIFLVEGDSAGGSAKMGRDKEFQAILPLRGKILNAWEVERDRLFANHEIHDISVAIGVDPHGPMDQADLSGLRYRRICILSDADVDGAHIQVLLLTLFLRHFPQLIKTGHVYVARPPLYRVDVPAAGKRPARKLYCLDQAELDVLQEKLRGEGLREGGWRISRFKGLGEMNAEQLWDTTLNPDTRRLVQVRHGPDGREASARMFDMLMARGESARRRSWLEEKGNLADVDV